MSKRTRKEEKEEDVAEERHEQLMKALDGIADSIDRIETPSDHEIGEIRKTLERWPEAPYEDVLIDIRNALRNIGEQLARLADHKENYE